MGPELEFFLFHTDDDGLPTTLSHESAGYFDLGPLDLGENARRDMVLTLEDMGFEIESSHHEAAPAQHEIDFRYDEALTTADNIMTIKLVVQTIAKRHGLHATFMPKPKFGINGSGMHLNMSISRDGINVFQDAKDENGLSKEAYCFIGGIMKHMKALTFITNPSINSYKRLIPGYEAPVYIAWSAKNRTPLIRIPGSRGEYTRVELRNPDPSANPYLALAVCLAAGLDGIKQGLMPPKAVNRNVYEMTDEELIDQLREGDRQVMDYIGDKYKNLVRSKAKSMYILGGDSEDLIQEGMIGLFKAVRDYDCGRDASFYTFADLCISRQMYTAVQASKRLKHSPLNSYVSLYERSSEGTDNEEKNLIEALAARTQMSPEELFLDKERVEDLERAIETELSSFEKQVLDLYLTGMSYTQIAKVLGRDEKSTDNALQRLKSKIRRLV